MCAHVCRDSVTEALLKDFSKEADWFKQLFTDFVPLCSSHVLQNNSSCRETPLTPIYRKCKWRNETTNSSENMKKSGEKQRKCKFLSTNQACPKSPSATTIYSSYRAIKYIFNIIPLRILWITSYCCLEKRLSRFSCCDQIISTWFIRDRVF